MVAYYCFALVIAFLPLASGQLTIDECDNDGDKCALDDIANGYATRRGSRLSVGDSICLDAQVRVMCDAGYTRLDNANDGISYCKEAMRWEPPLTSCGSADGQPPPTTASTQPIATTTTTRRTTFTTTTRTSPPPTTPPTTRPTTPTTTKAPPTTPSITKKQSTITTTRAPPPPTTPPTTRPTTPTTTRVPPPTTPSTTTRTTTTPASTTTASIGDGSCKPARRSTSYQADLGSAASEGNMAKVRALVEQGADLEAKYQRPIESRNICPCKCEVVVAPAEGFPASWTALQLAAFRGKADVVRLLLENCADIQAKEDSDDLDAMQLAAYKGHIGVMEVLLEFGGQVNGMDIVHPGEPLLKAVLGGKLASVNFLLDRGADINVNNGEAMKLAVRSVEDDVEIGQIAKALRSRGISASIPPINQRMCLDDSNGVRGTQGRFGQPGPTSEPPRIRG